MLTLATCFLLHLSAQSPGEPSGAPQRRIAIDHDNLIIRESCTLVPGGEPILDLDDNGVVQIVGDDIEVIFDPTTTRCLMGARAETAPEDYAGIGIRISGQRVKLSGARVTGFRVGIQAQGANRLELSRCDVSDNRRARLASTPEAEASSDWLSPHENDAGQWGLSYGAGIQIQGGEFVKVSRCRARDLQNGLLLERTRAALVSDNDFSFLSGWGIALWRTNQSFITRNAVDFCIRGYSHGVYNRGQDSAGILLFEQCSNNVIAENSATHCGDGLFAFAGREALGESGPEELDRRRRGNNDNLIVRNDFSYAAAHGLEITFSFGNKIFGNRFVDNAICGLWGGYSRETVVSKNLFVDNGQAGSGREGGAINIEHGQQFYIINNEFIDNSVGVRLWWDEDASLAKLPWTKINGYGSGDNVLAANRFSGGPLGVELILAGPTTLAENSFSEVGEELRADPESTPQRLKSIGIEFDEPTAPAFGESEPVGARADWNGRENIHMGPYGPLDLAFPQIVRLPGTSAQHAYLLCGAGSFGKIRPTPGIKLARTGRHVLVRAVEPGVLAYALVMQYTPSDGGSAPPYVATGILVQTQWSVRFFPCNSDPRQAPDAWQRAADAAQPILFPSIEFDFGMGGPGELSCPAGQAPRSELAGLPKDQFGTLAETRLHLPAGHWRINVVADDGVRLWIDDELRIDAWKHQAATAHSTELRLDEAGEHTLRLGHFELDGAAQLSLQIQALSD